MAKLLKGRIEANRPLKVGDRLGWLSHIEVHGAPRIDRERVVRIERQSPVGLVGPSLVILLPRGNYGGDRVNERILVGFG